MLTFILNNKIIKEDIHPGTSLLDIIRYKKDLYGTKVGCREGDCGACTVLEGSLIGEKVVYKSIVSCLTPAGNIHGKHIVTIEGLNMSKLSPVQEALVDNSGTQCGFCTPGFVMSLTCHCMEENISDKSKAINAISGNICRCTGYKSIERAAGDISSLMKNKDIKNPVMWLVEKEFIPAYFKDIPGKLKSIQNTTESNGSLVIGGGTDLMVQKPEEVADKSLKMLYNDSGFKGIFVENNKCIINASSTASDIMNSQVVQEVFPEILTTFKLVSSEPVRNMGTIAGNIVNASPIADLSIFFLALNPDLILIKGNKQRNVKLKDFYLGYKKLDLEDGELIKSLVFEIPEKPYFFNFEKVSKRTYLDIASVNSACFIKEEKGVISNCFFTVGGVSPVPLFLEKTSAYLEGKEISIESISSAAGILQEEISPISDVRGSEKYKRLLARQLFFAHFIKLFPGKITFNKLIENNNIV